MGGIRLRVGIGHLFNLGDPGGTLVAFFFLVDGDLQFRRVVFQFEVLLELLVLAGNGGPTFLAQVSTCQV